ncbi:MAG: glycoside hydrolase family 3 protein [Nocardioidaceae bacterium]|nr:glycoside hydrolase family 3 protein [Nocardioidaceae bacterium]
MRSLVQSVLMPGFEGTTTPDWLARRLETGLAGVCWFGQNVTGPEQARQLADELHGAREGVLVLSDEEGGAVSRLEAGRGSSWPGHASLGQLDDVTATHAVAAALGRQVRGAGVDVALSPCVDVNSDPDNPVIGVRSFGSSPELVSRHGAAFVRGLQSSGVASCAKHFPGHGATRTDSHVDLPYVDASAAVLRERDIEPFAAVVEAGVQCVMTAHVVFPALDDQPATMSPTLLSLLRGELGFEGVIISDALDMHAISRGVGRGPGAVRALAAGVDLVCIGNPSFPSSYDAEVVLDEVADAVQLAVEDGSLRRDRLEQAAARVADLATWVAKGSGGAPPDGPATSGDSRAVGRDVARRVVQPKGDVRVEGVPLVIELDGPINVAAGRQNSPFVAELRRRHPQLELISVASESDLAALPSGQSPVVVLVGQRRDADTSAALHAVLAAHGNAVVVYTGIATDDDPGERTVHSFGGGRAIAEAVADLICGVGGGAE